MKNTLLLLPIATLVMFTCKLPVNVTVASDLSQVGKQGQEQLLIGQYDEEDNAGEERVDEPPC